MTRTKILPKFALCIKNKGGDDLVVRKVYRILPDATAERENYLRVVDESGDDYLYPASYFVALDLPAPAQKALTSSRRRTAVPT